MKYILMHSTFVFMQKIKHPEATKIIEDTENGLVEMKKVENVGIYYIWKKPL